MKPLRIDLYGNFGAGNLGNECTLQAVIEKILQRRPDAQLRSLCTDPEDVWRRHGISALRASMRGAAESSPFEPKSNQSAAPAPIRRPAGPIGKLLRFAFRRLPLEFVHWARMLRAIGKTDMLIVAGTGIVADYMCGPLGWPYDMFKLSLLAKLCRVKLVFLSVGVGPIDHPLSRWFIKTSLRFASFRSYRDEASRRCLAGIGFGTDRDSVYPDVVFGLSGGQPRSNGVREDRRRVVGLGLKDYSGVVGQLETAEYRRYLDTMTAFVSWLYEHDFSVRLLIGDFQYDSRVIDDFVDLLRSRNLSVDPSRLVSEPARSVDELLAQLAQTDVVISARYHNLVMAMVLDKPVMALSDHAKLDSLLTDLGLAQYLVPLENLRAEELIARFERLDAEAERLRSHIGERLGNYRRALDAQYALLLPEPAVR